MVAPYRPGDAARGVVALRRTARRRRLRLPARSRAGSDGRGGGWGGGGFRCEHLGVEDGSGHYTAVARGPDGVFSR